MARKLRTEEALKAHTGSGPQVARRTWDSRQTRRELAAIENPPIPPVQQFWDNAERLWVERDKVREAEAECRRQAIAARYQAIEDHNNAVREKRVFDSLLTMLWEKYGATNTECRKVKLLMERNHKDALKNIEMWEVTLLKLRAELTGNVTDNQIDWRSAVGRTK
jgi:hypothetical protein